MKIFIDFFYKISIYYSIISFLLVLVFLGMKDYEIVQVLMQILPPLLATIFAGLFFDFLETKKWQVTLGPIVSGLVIGLVGQFGERAWVLFLIGVLAMAVKFTLKLYGKNVFNPAASGLLFGILILSSHPSWWGGTGYPWLFYLWIPGLLLKLKRWAPMLGFLVLSVFFNGLGVLFSGSLLFFASVMLIEPITSPVKARSGLIYGVLVALSFQLLGRYTSFDPLIPSLLAGNVVGRILDRNLD